MTYQDFVKFLGKVEANTGTKGEEFADYVTRMMRMLDAADMEDFFGTEGWKHDIGFTDH